MSWFSTSTTPTKRRSWACTQSTPWWKWPSTATTPASRTRGSCSARPVLDTEAEAVARLDELVAEAERDGAVVEVLED